jgi:hypothetical protein
MHRIAQSKMWRFPRPLQVNLSNTVSETTIKLKNSHKGGTGGRVESKLGPLGTSAIYWPIVPVPGDCEDGEFGGR